MSEPKLAFHHVHLRVRDLNATVAWYEKVFGAKVVKRSESGTSPSANLEIGGSLVLVGQALPREYLADATPRTAVDLRYGFGHWGYKVDDLDAVVAHMKSHGAEFVRDIYTIRPGVRIAFVKTPEDDVIELVEHK